MAINKWMHGATKVYRRACFTFVLLLCSAVRDAGAAAITIARLALTATTCALPIEIAAAVGAIEWQFDLTFDPADLQVNVACDPFSGDIPTALS